MFVQWKQRPLSADGAVGPGRRVFDTCVHDPRGADRVRYVPVVVRTFRDEGRERREAIWQPAPGIRPCCLRDQSYPMARVGFWLDVFDRAAELDQNRKAPFRKELLAALDAILLELARVVPRPDDADFDLAHLWPAFGPSRGESMGEHLRRTYASLRQAENAGKRKARPRGEPRSGGQSPPSFDAPALTADQAAAVLGLRWPATLDEVKLAFRRAALEHHPDRGGEHHRMVELNAAMELLAELLGG